MSEITGVWVDEWAGIAELLQRERLMEIKNADKATVMQLYRQQLAPLESRAPTAPVRPVRARVAGADIRRMLPRRP